MASLHAGISAEWSCRGYTELRRLGGGTNGRVILARGNWSGALVAIRYLPARLLVDRQRTAAFRAGLARLQPLNDYRVARLRHYVEDPRVAHLHRYAAAGDGAAVVTDAVDGVPLSRTLSERLPIRAALTVFKQSLLGLAAVHALGLMYGDYQPTRLMISGRGAAKLTDVGIAVLSMNGCPPGKPVYWAPELWHGGAPSPAADVYAATCVFFECLVGARPYRAAELFSLMGGHTVAPVPADGVPHRLRPLVLSGMAKDPVRRPSAAALASQLDVVATAAYGRRWESAGLAELAAIVGPLLEPFPRRGRNYRARLVAVAVVAVAVVAAAAVVVRHRDGGSVGPPSGQARPTAPSLSTPPMPGPATPPRTPTLTTPPPPNTIRVPVPATADIYAAGQPAVPNLPGGGGTPPARIVVRSTSAFTFDASGTAACGGDAVIEPDGGACAGGATDLNSANPISGIANPISGIVHRQATQFLVGVFTAEDLRGHLTVTTTPGRLDFSKNARGTNFRTLEPQLNQTFFIGDGMTSDGVRQCFTPPEGATHLYLGIADGWRFQGNPGYYGNNTGGFSVTFMQSATHVCDGQPSREPTG